MKYIHKIIVLFVFTIALISCDKNENFEILPAVESFQIVTPSSGTVIVLNDTNLDNNALFISWETLSDATGTFDIEVAQTGTDFATSYLLGTTEAKNFSMTVNEINTFLLDVMGLDPETAVSLDIRILNNGTMTDSISVVLTPYKVEYTELYVVGNITDPQWSPADALAMTRTDLNIFEITLVLADGAEFKFLPTNTGWDGDFGEDPNNPGMIIQDGESNLSGYTAGTYKITVNLNTFTFEVVEILSSPRLAVPGNHQGWSPSTAPQLEASSASTTDFEGYVWLNGEYKFVAADADGVFDWNKGPDYGDNGSFAGILVEQNETNCTATEGYYFVQANTTTLTYSQTAVSWGIIGAATPGGWSSDTDLIYDATSKTLIANVDLVPGAFKFRGNNDWDTGFDLGTLDSDGNLQSGGDLTFDGAAGNYKVVLDLSNPRAYKYSITAN